MEPMKKALNSRNSRMKGLFLIFLSYGMVYLSAAVKGIHHMDIKEGSSQRRLPFYILVIGDEKSERLFVLMPLFFH